MTLPFIAANVIYTLRATCYNNDSDKRILLPATIDMRKPSDTNKVFFNHWSLLPFFSDVSAEVNFSELANKLKQQFIALSTGKFSEAFYYTNLLSRIAPPSIYSHFGRKVMGGTSGSAAFAFLPESRFTFDEFAGLIVRNIQHFPAIPPQTAIGFFFGQVKGRLNLTLSYCPSRISDETAHMILSQIQAKMESDE